MYPESISIIDVLVFLSIFLSICFVQIDRDYRYFSCKILYAMRLCFTLDGCNQSFDFVYSYVSLYVVTNNFIKMVCYICLFICWYCFFELIYHKFLKARLMAKIPERRLLLLIAWVGNILLVYMAIVIVIKPVTILYPFDKWPTLLTHSKVLQYAHRTGDHISDFLRDDDVKNTSDGYHIGRILRIIR